MFVFGLFFLLSYQKRSRHTLKREREASVGRKDEEECIIDVE